MHFFFLSAHRSFSLFLLSPLDPKQAAKQIETLVVLPGFGGGDRRMDGGHVTEWGPAYGKK